MASHIILYRLVGLLAEKWKMTQILLISNSYLLMVKCWTEKTTENKYINIREFSFLNSDMREPWKMTGNFYYFKMINKFFMLMVIHNVFFAVQGNGRYPKC